MLAQLHSLSVNTNTENLIITGMHNIFIMPIGELYHGTFRYQSDYVTQGNLWVHDIYYSWQIVSENCKHAIVISANNTCIVCFSKYRCALLLYNNFVMLLQSSIFAGSIMLKTFTES